MAKGYSFKNSAKNFQSLKGSNKSINYQSTAMKEATSLCVKNSSMKPSMRRERQP